MSQTPTQRTRTAAPVVTGKDAYRRFDVELADLVTDAIDKGTAPWMQEWSGELTEADLKNYPRNPDNDREYSGANRIMLTLAAQREGFTDPRWMTMAQANAKGGHVRPGSHAVNVLFVKTFEYEKDADGKRIMENGKPKMKRLAEPETSMVRLFNAQQIENYPALDVDSELEAIKGRHSPETAEKILENSKAVLRNDAKGYAFYSRKDDCICIPPRESYENPNKYLAAAMGALSAWTGGPRHGALRDVGQKGTMLRAREHLRVAMASWLVGCDTLVGNIPYVNKEEMDKLVQMFRQNVRVQEKDKDGNPVMTKDDKGNDIPVYKEDRTRKRGTYEVNSICRDVDHMFKTMLRFERGPKIDKLSKKQLDAIGILLEAKEVVSASLKGISDQNVLDSAKSVFEAIDNAHANQSKSVADVAASLPDLMEKMGTLLNDQGVAMSDDFAKRWNEFEFGGKDFIARYDTPIFVPVDQKDKAIELGATFDTRKNLWIAPKGADLSAFKEAGFMKPDRDHFLATDRTRLDVPFAEKDQAKALGARWDARTKEWFAPRGTDLKPLDKWVPTPEKEKAKQAALEARAAERETRLNRQAEFAEKLKKFGLDLGEKGPIMDGKTHSVPVIGGKGRGEYCIGGEGVSPDAAWAVDHTQNDRRETIVISGHVLTNDEKARQIENRAAEIAQSQDKAAERHKGEYDKCEGLSADKGHPSLEAKGLSAADVTKLDASLHIDKTNNLLIPMQGRDGEFRGFQSVQPDGRARYSAGMKMKGAFHQIPASDQKAKGVLICKDYQSGVALAQATGKAVYVGFENYNMKDLAQTVKGLHPDSDITICATAGRLFTNEEVKEPTMTRGAEVSIDIAKEAALAVGAKVAIPDLTVDDRLAGKTEFIDLAQKDPKAVSKAVNAPKFDFAKEYKKNLDNADRVFEEKTKGMEQPSLISLMKPEGHEKGSYVVVTNEDPAAKDLPAKTKEAAICEDYPSAVSVNAVVNTPAVCAFTPENVAPVVEKVNEKHPETELTVCVSQETSLRKDVQDVAKKTKSKVNGVSVSASEKKRGVRSVADVHKARGAEGVRKLAPARSKGQEKGKGPEL